MHGPVCLYPNSLFVFPLVMARSDLLISLVKAGKQSPDPRFRSTVEALIAEERSKQHTGLADQLAAALVNGAVQPVPSSTVVGDLLYEIAPERSLDDLVLPHLVRDECRRVIEEQQRGELLRSYGLAPRHRLLLVGPPGNGKTSVAHGLAHDLMVPLLVVRYEGLIGSYLGETASRLRKVFAPPTGSAGARRISNCNSQGCPQLP